MKKRTLIKTFAILEAIILPLFIQAPLNRLFRKLFNPPGWIVLQPPYRVQSTLLCFAITYIIGIILLTIVLHIFGLMVK